MKEFSSWASQDTLLLFQLETTAVVRAFFSRCLLLLLGSALPTLPDFFFSSSIIIRNRLDTVSPSHINICNYQKISIQVPRGNVIAIKSEGQMLIK